MSDVNPLKQVKSMPDPNNHLVKVMTFVWRGITKPINKGKKLDDTYAYLVELPIISEVYHNYYNRFMALERFKFEIGWKLNMKAIS